MTNTQNSSASKIILGAILGAILVGGTIYAINNDVFNNKEEVSIELKLPDISK